MDDVLTGEAFSDLHMASPSTTGAPPLCLSPAEMRRSAAEVRKAFASCFLRGRRIAAVWTAYYGSIWRAHRRTQIDTSSLVGQPQGSRGLGKQKSDDASCREFHGALSASRFLPAQLHCSACQVSQHMLRLRTSSELRE